MVKVDYFMGSIDDAITAALSKVLVRGKMLKPDGELKRERRVRGNRKEAKAMIPSQFVGIDGEGITVADNVHLYTLLATSDRTSIFNQDGLRTAPCLEYLFDVKRRNPAAVFVSFYFSYDTNMILGNLHPESIFQLRKSGFCFIYDKTQTGRCIKIEYFPRKFVTFTEGIRMITEAINDDGEVIKTRHFRQLNKIQIWDVFGFFQSSFVKALKQYDIGDKDVIDHIEAMKTVRSDFIDTDNASVAEYNQMECSLLVELMQRMDESLIKAGLKLRAWHGAGAVAGALMKKHGINKYIHRPEINSDHYNAVMHGYFGGRIQAVQLGVFDRPVYSHDIVSSYPSTIQFLPNLAGCDEVTYDAFVPDLPELSTTIWHVSWDVGEGSLIPPFPHRDVKGNIDFPYAGEGYYWHCEVMAAMRHYPGQIEVIRGYGFIPADDYMPFSFVPELFEQRKVFKAAGDHTQLVIKLGLNSLYGKCAQSKGYNGAVPAYQSYINAGLITAHTRARLFDLAMQSPENVVAFSTDGLYSFKEHDCLEGKNLGEWERDFTDDFFIIKPGFYRGVRDDKELAKVRGFRVSEVDWSELREIWLRDGVNGELKTESDCFIGMKASRDLSNWRTWEHREKKISLMPTKGVPVALGKSHEHYRIMPMSAEGVCSEPYVGWVDDDENNDGLEDENSVSGA